ncbi:glycosyltransferase family 2 protein [Pyxidicoccus xibeiensis]|uniref:glycosyltransferase family 2 protein n=1 Tax=Pyxidicoccus xibeiensis TaxID=2906759 RepID=UPI0020A7655A|nr:glycosyltransferase family 2 protein [Pyxidicoccus xibeiensis]MCP3138238.1 glycosyltransferase family 2 protein [Pyxidicoccus xibeiensis]
MENRRGLIVLLAYNEEECIGSTVAELREALPGMDVLVVDDGSADQTAARAREAGAHVLTHPFNLGVAAGEATGLLYASRQGYQRVLRMDGDGQHDPASVPMLLEALDAGKELVIGSRFAGVTTFRSTWLRRFGNQFLSRLLSTLTQQRITDPTSGFRGFGPRAIAFFGRTHPHDYPEPESVLMASRQGFPITEVPARMRPRRTGTSSLTPWKSAFYMAKVSFALLMERVRPV